MSLPPPLQSPTDEDDITGRQLLDDAERAAKEFICEWIRASLHEVFLQTLKHHWAVESNEEIQPDDTQVPGESTVKHVIIVEDALEKCQDAVNKASSAWSKELVRAGQAQVAEWVHEVAIKGRDTVWAGKSAERSQGSTTNQEKKDDDQSAASREQRNVQDSPQPTDDMLEVSRERRTKAHGRSKRTIKRKKSSEKRSKRKKVQHEKGNLPSHLADKKLLPHSKLMRLGQPHKLGDPRLTAEEALQQLSEIVGENPEKAHKTTHWPYGWHMIQNAVENIPERIYMRAYDNNSSRSYQVIPRSLYEKQQEERTRQQQDQEFDPNETEERSDSILFDADQSHERAVAKLIDERMKKRERRKVTRVASRVLNSPQTSLVNEQTRPPSGIHSCLFPLSEISDGFSAEERRVLDAYLHPTNDPDTTDSNAADPAPSTLFGELRPIGQMHHMRQRRIDGASDDHDDFEDFAQDERLQSDTKTRRAYRRSVKERLGAHKLEEEHSFKSRCKVIRTIDSGGRRWYEFDMAGCLMDVTEEDGGERRLCAFSSVEIALEDVDTSIVEGEKEDDVLQKEKVINPDCLVNAAETEIVMV